jgi:hypothetical protein
MASRVARVLVTGVALGALCLWSEAAVARGPGGHFGGGGMKFGRAGHFGGGMRFGGGGMRFGGTHFGAMRFGGSKFGATRLGSRAFAHAGTPRFRKLGVNSFARHQFSGRRLAAINRHAGASQFRGANRVVGLSNKFAHAQTIGHGKFNQLHGFNSLNGHAFNRNAFGNKIAWNRWGSWRHGCCGWFGSVFWPFFFGDVLTTVLWPWADYDPFWGYGSDYLLTSIFWWGPGGGSSYAANDIYDIYGGPNRLHSYADDPKARRRVRGGSSGTSNAEVPSSTSNAALTETCVGLAPGVTDLPIGNIERTISPAGEQIAAFDSLKSALARAHEVLRASCASDVPLTPVSRLAGVERRLNAMIQVVHIMSEPLENLYHSLTEEQRRRLDAMGARTNRPSDAPLARGLVALCNERTEKFSQVPVQQIEQTIRPTPQQQTTFDALRAASTKAADELRKSCPTLTPQTVIDRLPAVEKRLAAMTLAVSTVRPALDDFYASLSDEQKARFNTMGQAQAQAGGG